MTFCSQPAGSSHKRISGGRKRGIAEMRDVNLPGPLKDAPKPSQASAEQNENYQYRPDTLITYIQG